MWVAGPGARVFFSSFSRPVWSPYPSPGLGVRVFSLVIPPATVMAVSFSGELAYEIHVPNASLYAAYLAVKQAGAAFGIKLFGARAVDSMRLEKGFLHWKADLITEFDPFETGLDRFVKLDKEKLVGRENLLERREQGPTKRLVTLKIGTKQAPAPSGASLMLDAQVVGTVTSGEWGHRLGMNLAYAFVDVPFSDVGSIMELDLCGMRVDAEVIAPSPYDPKFERLRA
ncbi:MAG: glycine cleavage T C-terminal barrel domain-containing protein [Arenibacterium sp.]